MEAPPFPNSDNFVSSPYAQLRVSLVIMVEQESEKNNKDTEMLKELRSRLGWTQSEMAQRFHVALRTWQQYEGGERRVRFYPWQVRTLLHLLEQAGLKPAEILPEPPKVKSKLKDP